MDEARLQLGRWTWDRTSNELRSAGEMVRLQDRAARTLALLVARMNTVVSRDAIVSVVWDGRTVSGNSVPMVIGQLRKALGTGAGSPAIETIPKRGYRLTLPETPREEASVAPGVRKRVQWLGTAFTMAAVVLAVLLVRPGAVDAVAVPPLRDETGDPAYAPLARATDALLVSRIVRRGLEVSRATGDDREVITSKLVVWDGRPFLSLQFQRDGTVVWSAMIDSADGGFPQAIEPKLDEWINRRKD